MELSCAFPPSLDAVEHIVEAERLGYERAWLFDSPALYPDIWVIAALAALRTERIGLGPAVLVPNLRHPLTQASAIATLEQLAPGRTRRRDRHRVHRPDGDGQARAHVGVHAPLHRAGARVAARRSRSRSTARSCKCCTATVSRPSGPIATPIVVAANGPKGMEVARRARRRRDDRRRRRAVVRLVLGAHLRNRARRRRAPGLGSGARGRGPGAHRRVPRDVRRRSRLGRRPARRSRVAGADRGGPRSGTPPRGTRGSSRAGHRPGPAAAQRRPAAARSRGRGAPPTCAPGWSRSPRRA